MFALVFVHSRQEHYSQRIVQILYRYIPWDGLFKVLLNIYHGTDSEYGNQSDFNNACRKAYFEVEIL